MSVAEASFWDTIIALVTINPLHVELSEMKEVEVGKVFRVIAIISNKGEDKIDNVKAEIFLPQGLAIARKDPAQDIKVIPGNKEKKTSWSVRAQETGNYVVSVLVAGEVRGNSISAQDTEIVKVVEPSPPRANSLSLFKRFSDFFLAWIGI